MRISALVLAVLASTVTFGCGLLGSGDSSGNASGAGANGGVNGDDPSDPSGGKMLPSAPYKAQIDLDDLGNPFAGDDGGATSPDANDVPDSATPDDAAPTTTDAATNDGGAATGNDAGAGSNDAGKDATPITPIDSGGGGGGTTVLRVQSGQSIQSAVNRANDGDVIQVAGGTYSEDVLVQGKSVQLLGGFASDFSSRNPQANESRIQGSGAQSVVRVLVPGKTVTVDGFTITGGTGNPDVAHGGAGIYFDNGNATFSNNHIIGNVVPMGNIHMTDTRGGGIEANGEAPSRVTILNNVIENNVSGRGAGIASSGLSQVVISGNVVRNNRAYSDHGGGMFLNSPDITVTQNVVDGNQIGPVVNPYGYGGGIYVFDRGTNAKLSYNVVTNNIAVTVASGVFIDNGAHAALDHELIYGNACTQSGGTAITVDSTDESDLSQVTGSIVTIDHSTITGHACNGTLAQGNGVLIGGYRSRATITNSIFWDNGPAQFNYGRSADVPPTVTSAFTSDPLFVNPSQHDYHLQNASAARGFGVF